MVYVFFGQSLLKSQAIESYYMYKQKSKQTTKTTTKLTASETQLSFPDNKKSLSE